MLVNKAACMSIWCHTCICHAELNYCSMLPTSLNLLRFKNDSKINDSLILYWNGNQKKLDLLNPTVSDVSASTSDLFLVFELLMQNKT